MQMDIISVKAVQFWYIYHSFTKMWGCHFKHHGKIIRPASNYSGWQECIKVTITLFLELCVCTVLLIFISQSLVKITQQQKCGMIMS